MSFNSNPRRRLEFDHLYCDQCDSIGDVRRIDEAVAILHEAIARAPEDFPVVSGTRTLRLAITDPMPVDGVMVPRLKLWFSIEDTEHIRLRSIEAWGVSDDDEEF